MNLSGEPVDVQRAAHNIAQRYGLEDRYPGDTLTRICREIAQSDRRPDLPGLDLGAGTCGPTSFLAEHRRRMIAVDFSFAMLSQASASARFQRVAADVTDLPFADSGFGLATIFSAFHLVEDKDRLVEEVRRILHPGGVFCVIHVERNDLRAQLTHKGFPQFHAREIGRHITARELGLLCSRFDLGESRIIKFQCERSYANAEEFLAHVAQKPFFGLVMLEEWEFEEGIGALSRYVLKRYPSGPVVDQIKLTLAVFEKRKDV